MDTNKRPSPDRIFAVIAAILQRRYDVRIQYTITKS